MELTRAAAAGPDVVTDVGDFFDLYARLVRRALDVPVSLVTMIEADRQVFPGAVGLPAPLDTERATPLTHSICQYVVADRRPLIVPDTRSDDQLHDHPAVRDLGVQAYAGYPLTDHNGQVIGSLCAIDDRAPRSWAPDELALLADLAAACSSELAQRLLGEQAAGVARRARDLTHRSRVLLALSEGLSSTRTTADIAAALQQISVEQLGCVRAGIWLCPRPEPVRVASSGAPASSGSAAASPYAALRLVPVAGLDWPEAAAQAELPVDDTTPLGEVLLRRVPLYLQTLEELHAGYPGVHGDPDAESRAFLPLIAQGQTYGALALLWSDARALSWEDRRTITALTSYITQALQRALLLEERLEALVTLQQSLLPPLPQPGNLELAARYRPAATQDQVGGDWYDAVIMPSGLTALMIGDVVGHDLAAAAVMGQVRNMLRAFACAVDDPPSGNVGRLDQAMRDLRVDGMASLVYARIEADPREDSQRNSDGDPGGAERPGHLLRWTNAGHPPPLLVSADGSSRFLDEAEPDLMLGIEPVSARTDNRTLIEAGSVLMLYTDGLVERRGEDLTTGLARLAAAAGERWGSSAGSLEGFLDAILGELLGPVLADDVAVLAVRF